jgi:hypothetical protein
MVDALLTAPVKVSANVVVIVVWSPRDGVIVNVPADSLVIPAAPATLYVVAPSGPLGGKAPSVNESRKISFPSLIIQNSSKTGVKGSADTPVDVIAMNNHAASERTAVNLVKRLDLRARVTLREWGETYERLRRLNAKPASPIPGGSEKRETANRRIALAVATSQRLMRASGRLRKPVLHCVEDQV